MCTEIIRFYKTHWNICFRHWKEFYSRITYIGNLLYTPSWPQERMKCGHGKSTILKRMTSSLKWLQHTSLEYNFAEINRALRIGSSQRCICLAKSKTFRTNSKLELVTFIHEGRIKGSLPLLWVIINEWNVYGKLVTTKPQPIVLRINLQVLSNNIYTRRIIN